jgi:hypothetical protein
VTRELETAKQVRRNLEIVCQRLESPTRVSLDASAGELTSAIRSIGELEASLRSAASTAARVSALASEISGIRRELTRAQALLAAAGKFYQGWARLITAGDLDSGGGAVNYTARGVSGPVLAVDHGQVVLHG